MPASEHVSSLIVRKYFDKGNTREVNYFLFCGDVDRPEDMFPGYVSKNPVPLPAEPTEMKKTMATFFQGSTKEINVL